MTRKVKPYETKEEKIYRDFGDELEVWSQNGNEPSLGNQDIRYYLDLQEARLKKRNLKMEYQLLLRGGHHDKIRCTTYQDRIYTNILAASAYMRKLVFHRNGRKLYEKEEPQFFYQTITRMDQQRPEENYCCPNCGAVSPVKVLLEGCPHCRTRFLMQDLFPKVTAYFFEHDFTMTDKEAKRKVTKWVLGGILITFLPSAIGALFQEEASAILLTLLFTLLGSVPIGAFFGYYTMSLCMAIGLFGYAGGNLPRLFTTMGTKRKLTRLMKPYDKNFSYEYFVGRILGLLQILIFSDSGENLAVYEGEGEIPDYSNIVESSFRGSIRLHKRWVDKGYAYVDLSVYMANIYDTGRIHRKNDLFRMVVCRKLQKDSDLGFSIKKVQCAGCAASFDATRERCCPYCGREYHLKEDDWVVMKIRKR